MDKKIELDDSLILPGDHIAFLEEFEDGLNTYISKYSVRSDGLGVREYDFKRRIVNVKRKSCAQFPKIGDIVIGYVEMLFGSMISIRIITINNKKLSSGLSAIASTRTLSGSKGSGGTGRDSNNRRDRDRRSRFVFRVGDIVKGRIFSLLNSSSHATINESNLGVLYCLCSNCGGETVKLDNRVKCIECGMVEDKKLSSDFGKDALISLV